MEIGKMSGDISAGHKLEQVLSGHSSTVLPASELELRTLSVQNLADRCISEINKYHDGAGPYNEHYCLELFRRATVECDSLAQELLQKRLNEIMLRWMLAHPQGDIACSLDSEDSYVAQAFARFWQATTHNQVLEFTTLAAALRYLRASLNGAVLDTLRASLRPEEIPLPKPGSPTETCARDQNDSSDVWEVLLDGRQQRLAYLLFHCGLKPREIVEYYPQEFGEIGEVYSLRRNIIERLRSNADRIPWQLDSSTLRINSA
jgi:hypothetical protein